MADEAVACIGGYFAGSAASMAATKLATIAGAAEQDAVVGGYIGVGVGIAAAVYFEIREPLHGVFEYSTDWWDMLCW